LLKQAAGTVLCRFRQCSKAPGVQEPEEARQVREGKVLLALCNRPLDVAPSSNPICLV